MKAQSSSAVFSCAYCPPSFGLNFCKGWGCGKSSGRRKGGGAERCQFSDACISTHADNLPVRCIFNQTFRTPQKQSLLSLPEEFQKENKNKKPQVFRYWDLTNQPALSGLSQRMQWSLPPLTALRMNTNVMTALNTASH